VKNLAGKFSNLKAEEKQVYSWLEFIAFGHLMTPEIVEQSLGCLSENQDKIAFRSAYDIIKLKDITMNKIENSDTDLYRLIREKEKEEREKIKSEKSQKVSIVQKAREAFSGLSNIQINALPQKIKNFWEKSLGGHMVSAELKPKSKKGRKKTSPDANSSSDDSTETSPTKGNGKAGNNGKNAKETGKNNGESEGRVKKSPNSKKQAAAVVKWRPGH
jgi:hypothetical protein